MSEKTNEEKYTAKDIKDLLQEKFSDTRHYTYADEVGDSTGLSQTRRLDFCVIDHFESSGFSIDAFEIKVSKSDLMSEIRNPEKHNIFFKDLNTFSLVCPNYILDKRTLETVPPKWGIYVVKNNTIRAKRKPIPLHDEKVEEISKGFVASFIRRINKPATDKIDENLRNEYRRGYEEGSEHEKKLQKMEAECSIGREKDYITCYKELLTILEVNHYTLKETIPIIRLILSTDSKYLKGYLEDTITNLNKLNDMLGDDFEVIKARSE